MLLERIKLKNLLSFGPEGIDLELRKLNVLIGPNGSGKSNLIEAIGLLKAMPRDLAEPIREGGGIRDWLWRGGSNAASIETLVPYEKTVVPIRHRVDFAEVSHHLEVLEERIEDAVPIQGFVDAKDYYQVGGRRARIRTAGKTKTLLKQDIDSGQSILSQRKDPSQFSEMTYLGERYSRIAIYRDWVFGRGSQLRESQRTDLRNDHLDANGANLPLVLSSFKRFPTLKRMLIKSMGKLFDGIVDFEVLIEGGRAQLFLEEDGFSVPSARLSDGTLRYLSLLAILLDPYPPALVCIDEPELGLHPDLIGSVSELLINASDRMQLIVTSHSDVLVDALSKRVEDVVVCERGENGSQMRRLQQSELKKWLAKYSLGQLWSRGQIGGNRW